MRSTIAVLSLAMTACGAGCRESATDAQPTVTAPHTEAQAASGEAPMYEQADAVRRELRALLERPVDPIEGGPFLIITVTGTDKFVQFAGGAGEDLLFDLPRAALTDAEFERAGRFLPSAGVSMSAQSDTPSFIANFGSDVDAAAEAVGVVLMRVYEFDAAAGLGFEGM